VGDDVETDDERRITRVMLVDDHPLFRAGVRQRLFEHDVMIDVVGEAGNAHEALEMATRLMPDVVLMDVALQGESGIEVTRAIKQAIPATAIIMLSMYDNVQYIEAAIEAGAAGYFLKTVQGPELAAAVHQAHEGDAVLNPEVAAMIFRRLLSRSRGARHPERLRELSQRETEVLALIANGAPNKQIARTLDLSVRTVHAHLRSIYSKLQVTSRTEAAMVGLKEGMLKIEEIDIEGPNRVHE
jgi:NarL family two-component system response regulator LiaR